MSLARSVALFVLAAAAEKYDVVGAAICLAGVAVITCAPRPA